MKMYFIFFNVFVILFSNACKKSAEEIAASTAIVKIDTTDTTSEIKEFIKVRVLGFKNTNGQCNIALGNTKQSFDNKDNYFRVSTQSITGSPYEFTFEDVPLGVYTISLYHDQNSDNKLNTNLFGIPTEGFAFSNNAMGNFGPPDYESCTFTVPEGAGVIQEITLRFF